MNRRYLLLLFLVFILVEIPFAGYITDDTFIHLQYAKNLKNGFGVCFNRGEPTLGATSPLWVILIAASGFLTSNLLLAGKILGFLFSAGSILIFFRLSSLVCKGREFAIGATFAFAIDAWLVRWSISGMETPLFVFMALTSILLHESEKAGGERFGISPVFSALSALSRPEGALLAVIMLADRLLWKGKRLKSVLFALAVNLVVLSPWIIYAERTFGTVIPTTALVKAGRFAQSGGEFFAAAMKSVKVVLATQGPGVLIIAVALALAIPRISRRNLRDFLSRRFVLVAWLAGLPSFYVLRGVEVISRYLAPVLPVVTILAFLSLEAIYHRFRGRIGRASVWAGGLALVTAALNLSILRFEAYPHTAGFSRGMRESVIPIGKWLKANSPPAATVAVVDVGAVGYYSDRKVVDLGGLITPSLIPLLREREFNAEKVASDLSFGRFEKTDFLVDRSSDRERLLKDSRFRPAVRAIMTGEIPGLGITRPTPVYYTLYSIDWKKIGGQ